MWNIYLFIISIISMIKNENKYSDQPRQVFVTKTSACPLLVWQPDVPVEAGASSDMRSTANRQLADLRSEVRLRY